MPDTSKWLTRNEAADLLMVSTQTLMNYERQGTLHPRHDYRHDTRGAGRHVIVYDPQELAKCPRYNRSNLSPREREPGEVAARAFELFREGKRLDEVVIAVRSSPEQIEQLHDKWLDMSRADFVISPGAKMVLEELVGAFQSVAELVERVAKLKMA